MRTWLLLLLVLALPARAGTILTDIPDSPDPAKTHLIYLHGRIVENAGPRPTDPRYGLYDYPAVLEALASRGAVVVSAQRAPKTDMDQYAGVVVSQVEKLIERGVPPGNIVVVGFSKAVASPNGCRASCGGRKSASCCSPPARPVRLCRRSV
jgi:hypothetical protein